MSRILVPVDLGESSLNALDTVVGVEKNTRPLFTSYMLIRIIFKPWRMWALLFFEFPKLGRGYCCNDGCHPT